MFLTVSIVTMQISLIPHPLLPTRFLILLHPQLPGRPQSPSHHIFIRSSQSNMSRAHPAPSSSNGEKHLRLLTHKRGLLLARKHQVPVTLVYRGQRRENMPAYAEVHRAQVRAVLRAFKAQRNPPKIFRVHRRPSAPLTAETPAAYLAPSCPTEPPPHSAARPSLQFETASSPLPGTARQPPAESAPAMRCRSRFPAAPAPSCAARRQAARSSCPPSSRSAQTEFAEPRGSVPSAQSPATEPPPAAPTDNPAPR